METPPRGTHGDGEPKGPPPIPAAPRKPAPPTQAGQIGDGSDPTPDATGGVIPYKNPAALIAYYLGIFGLIPALGMPLALAAVILGFIGLRKRARKEAYGGQVHAWVGIVLGFASLAYHTGSIVLLVVL